MSQSLEAVLADAREEAAVRWQRGERRMEVAKALGYSESWVKKVIASMSLQYRGGKWLGPRRDDQIARFWSKVAKGDGCWEWQACRDGKGYGRTSFLGSLMLAHRVAWIATYGDIDPALYLCHRCDNPSCVRPDHLFLGTQADNMADASIKGRLKRPSPEMCRRGHRFSGRDKLGRKVCAECKNEWGRNKRLRARAIQ